nr:MAG TPA: hypothetical protein [Caudoviricetes sp.]
MWKYCGFYMNLRSIIVVSTIVNNRTHSFMMCWQTSFLNFIFSALYLN